MVGSIKKNKRSPAYERGEIDDSGIVREQKEDAAQGHDQREALRRLISKAVKKDDEQ